MKPKFSLSGSLSSAAQVGGTWGTASLVLDVIDRGGVYLLSHVVVNDRVFIDTSAFESGTYAVYRITSIGSRAGTILGVTAVFEGTGSAPDLSWCLQGTVIVSRAVNGVFAVPAPKTQGINDTLPFALLDQSIGEIVSLPSVSGITYTNGKVSGWTQGGDVFAATYGANGLTAVTKNGQPYQTVTYTNGLPTAVLPA